MKDSKQLAVSSKQGCDAELVNQLHAELREAEDEQPDLLRTDFRGTTREIYWKEVHVDGEASVSKRVEAYVTDNRKRWEALNDMYWFHTVVIPLMTNRKSA